MQVGLGDALLAGAALMWSLQTVRLGFYCPFCPTIKLAIVNFAFTFLFAVLWVSIDASILLGSRQSLVQLWPGCGFPLHASFGIATIF